MCKTLKIDFAPMEGLTTYSLRRVHHKNYSGVDRYFTPFLTANQTLHFQKKEIREILPINNEGIELIPQIMTNKPDQMLWALDTIGGYGYHECNLNLGCPYPTVVTRHKGAGFLEDPDTLDAFFEAVFEGMNEIYPRMKLSVKTRIGLSDPDEMKALLDVYNRYPICELIVHPRLQKQMYNGSVDMDTFAYVYENSANPVSYNGDILTAEDALAIQMRYPKLERVMIGRGLLRDPALAERIKAVCGQDGQAEDMLPPVLNTPEDLRRLRSYIDEQYLGFKEYVMRDKEVISHVKELWTHVGKRLPGKERELKKLYKAKTREEYLMAENAVFNAI